ncbi:intradiol_dioxygenase [Pycnococcus provasolii]
MMPATTTRKCTFIGVLTVAVAVLSPQLVHAVPVRCPAPSPSASATSYVAVVAQQEGPYYMENAPARTDGVLCEYNQDANKQETRLNITGRVLSARSECQPASATLDFWQADASGEYYDCPLCPVKAPAPFQDSFYCRGKVQADDNGRFFATTIMPHNYISRPVLHLHLKVHLGGEVHTTQLYFAHDPLSKSYSNDIVMDAQFDSETNTWVVQDHIIVVPHEIPSSASSTTTTEAATTTTSFTLPSTAVTTSAADTNKDSASTTPPPTATTTSTTGIFAPPSQTPTADETTRPLKLNAADAPVTSNSHGTKALLVAIGIFAMCTG